MEPKNFWPKLALLATLVTTECAFDFDRYDPAEGTGDATADTGSQEDSTSSDGMPGDSVQSSDAAASGDGPADGDTGPGCAQSSLDMAAQCGAGCREDLQSCLAHCHSNGCMQGCANSSQNCISGCVSSCATCTGPGAPSRADCTDAASPPSTAGTPDADAPLEAGTSADARTPDGGAALSDASDSSSQSQQQ